MADNEQMELIHSNDYNVPCEACGDPTGCGLKTARNRPDYLYPYGSYTSPASTILTDGVINMLCSRVHTANKTWWHDPATGAPLQRNVGEMLMLVVSEIAEAMEGHRKDLMDDKIPKRKMIEVELADAIIRIFDIAAGLNLDLGGAFVEKMSYNAHRADHKPEARLAPGGKKY